MKEEEVGGVLVVWDCCHKNLTIRFYLQAIETLPLCLNVRLIKYSVRDSP